MTRNERTRTATMIGRSLVAAGCTVLVIYVGLLGLAYSGGYSVEHQVSATAFVNGGVRAGARQCLVTSGAGEQRRVSVPAMPNRGVHVHGTRIEPWFTGTATIVCSDAVYVSQGSVVRFFPLIEQWFVLLLGLVLVCGGLSRLGLFRRTSRHP